MCYVSVNIVAFAFWRRYLYVRVIPKAICNKLLIVFGFSGIGYILYRRNKNPV